MKVFFFIRVNVNLSRKVIYRKTLNKSESINSPEGINIFYFPPELKNLKKLSLSLPGLSKLTHVFWMLILDGGILTWNMDMMMPSSKHRRTF
jgi:hypothetical protein